MRALARCRRAGRRDGGAGDSDDHRPRPGSDPRSRARSRRALGGLRIAAAAARSQADLCASGCSCTIPNAPQHVMSLVQQMRGGKDYDSALRHTHARRGTVRRPDRDALRQGPQAAGLRPAAAAGQFALRRAAQAVAARAIVLIHEPGRVGPAVLRRRHSRQLFVRACSSMATAQRANCDRGKTTPASPLQRRAAVPSHLLHLTCTTPSLVCR